MTEPSNDDDEYYFSEMSTQGDANNMSSSSVNTMYGGGVNPVERMSRKGILAFVGIIIIAFLGYKLAGVFLQNRHAAPPVPAPKKIAEPKQAVAPAHDLDEKINGALTDSSNAIAKRMADLNQQNQTAIGQIQQQYSALQNNVEILHEDDKKMGEALGSITNQLAQQQETLEKLMKFHEKPKPAEKKKVSMKPAPNYHVKAVVYGRAWLENDSDGSATTVTLGSSLPPYGYVRSIDLGRGLIFMSSGHVFSFAAEDR